MIVLIKKEMQEKTIDKINWIRAWVGILILFGLGIKIFYID